jgi:hypothetical protein
MERRFYGLQLSGLPRLRCARVREGQTIPRMLANKGCWPHHNNTYYEPSDGVEDVLADDSTAHIGIDTSA